MIGIDKPSQFILLHFSDHRASTKQFHCTLAVALAFAQGFHIILACSCDVGHQILLSHPLVSCLYGFHLKSCFFCGTGMLISCVSDSLPFLQFDSHHHWFLFCAHQHFFIRDKIRPEDLFFFFFFPPKSTYLLMCDWICLESDRNCIT